MFNKKKAESYKNIDDLLKDYDYVILVKDYKIKLWNNGRFEEKVKEFTFNLEYPNLPELIIRK